MPYSGASDPGLPKNVKKLAPAKRKRWVAIFNNVLKRGDSESSAFAIANGRTKAYLGRELEQLDLDFPLHFWSLKQLENVLLDNAFWAQQKIEVLKRLEPTMRAIFDEGVQFAQTIDVTSSGVKALVGYRDFLDPPEDLLDDIAGQVFRGYTDDWWNQLEHTTRERLRAAIMNAASNGTGSKGVIREIRPLFGEVRARRIGVTETTRLFGKGAVATYRATNVPEWIWRTVEDGRVCPTCESLGGTVYPVSQEFDPAHVTCRCFPSPVVRTNTRTRRAPRSKK